MKKDEEYLIERIITLGCIDRPRANDDVMILEEIDNPFKIGSICQRFSKEEIFEVR